MEWVEHSIDGPVAEIVLRAPSGPSRINVDSAREWLEVLERIEEDDGVTVIVIRADGPVWSAGGDLAEFSARGEEAPEFVLEIGKWINPVVATLAESKRVTVASVHGAVAGGGLGPMLACDLVIAAEDTAFTLGYSKLATNPDAGVSWYLPRLIGYRKALELYLTSDRLTAAEAEGLGMVNVVAPAERLEAETSEWAARLASLPPHAIAATKRLLRDSANSPLRAHLDDEITSFAENARHPDFAEGVDAFLARRDPEFGGS